MMSEADYEKLGLFYLGRPQASTDGKPAATPLLYDSRHLVTHGLCVGMTGSGKTGLGIGLLEEAAIDGIPALVIDPKGDMGNLMLTFPDLAPADFEPWVDPAEADRKGLTRSELAETEAEKWRKGLAEWGEGPDRIRRLRDAVDVTIYTPGSTAGVPLAVLTSLEAPGPKAREDVELMADRVATATASLLGLAALDGDSRSREYVLLSTLIATAWKQGQDLDLPSLIQQVQTPPVTRVGVLELESFYPAKDRFGLAMALNSVLASPGFSTWLEGEPLDIDRMLYTEEGKPRIAICSIAHLDDRERMFFVSLLLEQVVSWMREQSGTSSLRALIYMDELFGFLPPVAEPPSKRPLLTLLKQGRAFGVGLLLATQNPVDIDYKALSNIGTWFLGRLQTERDKNRLLDGLEGASGAQGFSRSEIDDLLSGLPGRVFLLHDVREDGAVLFQTRWVMSYLKGPLTRREIERLTADRVASTRADDESRSRAPVKTLPTPAVPMS
ncbi:MAG: ATP-binding protein, partial [Thermoanaerobaculia bacterium]|nr:ATP-binding protein [Thermoanaerobaculia bacterium]